jgi:hypothetical protein
MQSRIHQTPRAGDDELPEMPEPANLRFLRRMVTLLMVTMIVGIMVVAGALVMRIAGEGGGTTMTEIPVEAGYSVVSADHGAGDRLILVLEDEIGVQVVRVYRTKGAAEDYEIIEE